MVISEALGIQQRVGYVLVFSKSNIPSIYRDAMSTFVSSRLLGRCYSWKPLAITETFEESHLIAKTAKTDERASSALYSITLSVPVIQSCIEGKESSKIPNTSFGETNVHNSINREYQHM